MWGDTFRHLPWTVIQAGSNTTYTMTRANYVAAQDAKAKLQEIAAMELGGSPEDYDVADGRVFAKDDPSRALTFAQAAERAIELGGKYSGHEMPADISPITQTRSRRSRPRSRRGGQGQLGKERRHSGPRGGLHRGGSGRGDGDVEIVDYLAVPDCGRVLHPQSLSTQVLGGAVQGFGMARFERHIYDPHLGMRGRRGFTRRSRLQSWTCRCTCGGRR